MEELEQQQPSENQPTVEHHVGEQPSGAQPTPSTTFDPAEVERLKREYAQAQQILQTLAPHAERINRLIEEPDAAQFFDEAYGVFKDRSNKSPELPPELKAIHDDVVYLKDYVKTAEQKRQEQEQSVQQQRYQEDYHYAERLVAERPDLAEDNYWGIQSLAAYAKNNSITLEQAWKKVGSRFAKPVKQAAPPSSLRADAGEIGIPGRSDTQAPSTNKSFRDVLLERLKSDQHQRGA